MRVLLYTAIFGSIADTLRRPVNLPSEVRDSVRFVCFSDVEHLRAPSPWEVLPAVHTSRTPRRTARWHKIMAHYLPEHDVSVWIDGCLALRCNPLDIISDAFALGHSIAAFRHPQRRCVYREHEACRRHRKDDFAVMTRQMEMYQYAGYPPNNGLAETACLVRRNTEEVHTFQEEWWQLLDTYSHRDQLSFDFTLWRRNLPYAILPGCRDRSCYFTYYKHRPVP